MQRKIWTGRRCHRWSMDAAIFSICLSIQLVSSSARQSAGRYGHALLQRPTVPIIASSSSMLPSYDGQSGRLFLNWEGGPAVCVPVQAYCMPYASLSLGGSPEGERERYCTVQEEGGGREGRRSRERGREEGLGDSWCLAWRVPWRREPLTSLD
jgi:hypothetical protein